MRHAASRLAVVLFLLLTLSAIASAQEVVVSQTLTVAPGKYAYFPFYVRTAGTNVTGRFRAQGGSGNDIETFIVDEDGFVNYSNGHRVGTLYNSGRKTVGSINISLNPGRYYLIFNNSFSSFSNKVVEAHVEMIGYSAPSPSFSQPSSPLSGRVIVASNTARLLNVRSGPSSRAPIIGKARRYDRLYVIRPLGRWTEIQWNGGMGYVLTRYVGY